MVKHLYKDFLSFGQQYRSAQMFWRKLVGEIQDELSQDGEWDEWIPKTFADGTTMPRDGNPIFDARSSRCSKAIRVIQAPPTTNDVEIAAWMDKLDYERSGAPGYTEELTINCALSEESASIARALIREWMQAEASYDEMKAIIRQALADISA